MKVLIVSKSPTHYTTAGNRFAILAQAKIVRELGCEVHFLYILELPIRRKNQSAYFTDLEATRKYWGDSFYLFRVPLIQKAWFNLLNRIRKVFFKWECGKDDNYPVGFSRFVERLQLSQHYDTCIVNYYYLTKLLNHTSIPFKAVFTHDYFAYKNLVVGEKIPHLNADSEARAIQRAKYVFAIQEEEGHYYRLISPQSIVYTVFNAYEYHPKPYTGNHIILFLSGDNQFNVNGILWFVENVFPSIKDRFSDARLLIGGSICKNLDVIKQSPGVELLGFIENPSDFYSLADVAINPVYQGTGLKIKTFEAISHDKVTLVHPHSARGIFKPFVAPIILCETVDSWVCALASIWGNKDRIYKIKAANKAYMEEMSSFVRNEYRRFLQDVNDHG